METGDGQRKLIKKGFLDTIVSDAEKNGFTKTLYGRKRIIKELGSSNFQLKAMGKRIAMNAPIQGTAADILKLAMIRINNWFDEEKISNVFMIMQVHDELVFEIKKDDIPSSGLKISNLMTNVEALKVPLVVNTFHGNSWRDI